MDKKRVIVYIDGLLVYGLTYEEVLIVDPETTITREAYEKRPTLPRRE